MRVLRIEKITDIEQLRQVAVLLEAENARLHKRLEVLVAQLAALQGKSGSEPLHKELLKLQEQMAALQHRMFGRSSEKSPHTPETKEKKPQVGHGPKAQPQLPVVELRHELDEPDQSCTRCGNPLLPLGDQTEDSEEISVVQRKFVLVQHKRVKYRCSCCLTGVETATGPQKLLVGGRYSVEFAVEIALQKYSYHRVPRMHTFMPRGREESNAAQKMRVGPSESAYRGRFQTSSCCASQKLGW